MTKRHTRAAFAAALLAITLAGCSASAPSDGGSTGQVEVMPEQLAPGTGQSGAMSQDLSGGVALPDLSAAIRDSQQDRAIVRSASIELTVKSAQTAAADAAKIAADLGGTVASQTLANDGQSAEYADLTLRVPAEKLADALSELAGLGELRSETRSADDVTDSYVDLEARVEALSASITRLTELMEGAATTSELIEAESALAQRQMEFDGLNAQLEALTDQVEMASVWVSLREGSALPGGGPQTFWDAILAGFASIGSFFVGLVVSAGFALPWLVLLAVIALAILIPIRLRRRRARNDQSPEKALSTEATDSVATDHKP
ncbi:hypothetical protein ACI1US_00501 [Leucobacter sp. BZR 635]